MRLCVCAALICCCRLLIELAAEFNLCGDSSTNTRTHTSRVANECLCVCVFVCSHASRVAQHLAHFVSLLLALRSQIDAFSPPLSICFPPNFNA